MGAWFDTFHHYPVMAFKNREGGDKGHGNGVRFAKETRTKALKEFAAGPLKADLARYLSGPTLLDPRDLAQEATAVHDDTLATLSRLHDLPVHDTAQRTRLYREELEGSPAVRRLREAMDLWCACWFWPADELERAPLPTTLHAPGEETRAVARRVAAATRFFHWELEFPDVFREASSGFDAVLGNPPWDIAKPNSKEFFSNIDPLYRSYGKQEALRRQTAYFADETVERSWLDYNADFRAQSNFMKYAAAPFGDPAQAEASGDRFGIKRGGENDTLHERWRGWRAAGRGYADAAHPFRHQGSADLNLYKLFLETAHALLRPGGRLGFIVPSGLYSDHGTGKLRELFLDRCRWEWLFGFENREAIFDIHRSFKFNPVIVQKGGRTDAVRTAFMRRALEDWERGEELAVPYTRGQVERFSPFSSSLLEVQSLRGVEVLRVIFADSEVASSPNLGDRRLTFAKGDFDMVAGSKWFHARSDAFECSDVSVCTDSSGQTYLPLFEGRMVSAFDCSGKGWVRGRGRSALWRNIDFDEELIEPQWLVQIRDCQAHGSGLHDPRVGFTRVSSSTNARTMIAGLLPPFPTGFTACQLRPSDGRWESVFELLVVLNSFAFDYAARRRVGGLDIAWFHVKELPIPGNTLLQHPRVLTMAAQLATVRPPTHHARLALHGLGVYPDAVLPAVARGERLRLRCVLDAVVACAFGLRDDELRWILKECDHPATFVSTANLDPKGFWRVDKDKDPELRHTVLTLVAFHDLEEHVRANAGDRDAGIEAFLGQNQGDGWMLPETLRLADYGLGHDDRAQHLQPVASRLGPRFYDWQLSQSAEESWCECHLHARNLLGEEGYRELLLEIEQGSADELSGAGVRERPDKAARSDPDNVQGRLC